MKFTFIETELADYWLTCELLNTGSSSWVVVPEIQHAGIIKFE
ncbi:hypothetical protein X975_17858, partial [Stegodyphus mimosarum]